MSMNSYCTVIQKAVLIRRNSQFPQHYSFAVKAFVDVAKTLDMSQYELAIRETKTAEVIMDVSTMKSEIGVLYLSDFNRKSMEKLLNSANLEFHPLIECDAYVYLWKGHPLAEEACITMKQLENYPCLAFEQETTVPFIFQKNYCRQMNTVRLFMQMTERRC